MAFDRGILLNIRDKDNTLVSPVSHEICSWKIPEQSTKIVLSRFCFGPTSEWQVLADIPDDEESIRLSVNRETNELEIDWGALEKTKPLLNRFPKPRVLCLDEKAGDVLAFMALNLSPWEALIWPKDLFLLHPAISLIYLANFLHRLKSKIGTEWECHFDLIFEAMKRKKTAKQ